MDMETINTTVAFGFGNPNDIAIIGGVIVVLFGGAKLTQFGRSLGQGIREFKKEVHDEAPPAPVAPERPADAPPGFPNPAPERR